MKKTLLIIAMFIITLAVNAQDTIIGYSFPLNDTTSKRPNFGLSTNLGYDIRKETTGITTSDTITFSNGVTTGDFAATTTNWDGGANIKFWSIKFKAPNYTNFKLSSKQRSGGNNPGPKNFQIQWRLSSGNYADVANGAVVCANDWTTGAVNQLPVPITGQGTGSIYIRWLMTTNVNANGDTVLASGITKIDDIILTATSTTGIEKTIYSGSVDIYPNPSNGIFTIEALNPVKEIMVYNSLGALVFTSKPGELINNINLNTYGKGIYFVNVMYGDNSTYSGKVIVR
jgi:hypothetical protein